MGAYVNISRSHNDSSIMSADRQRLVKVMCALSCRGTKACVSSQFVVTVLAMKAFVTRYLAGLQSIKDRNNAQKLRSLAQLCHLQLTTLSIHKKNKN